MRETLIFRFFLRRHLTNMYKNCHVLDVIFPVLSAVLAAVADVEIKYHHIHV